MLSVNPASSGSNASSANDNSNIAPFVSQNSIGILAVVPSSPTSVVATSGNASLAVTWTIPVSPGSSAIAKYVVKYSSNGGARGSWTQFVPSPRLLITASSCIVTGLTNGTNYVVKVIAENAVGISLRSANSAPATPAATVPDSPTSVVATSGNAQLAVTWVASASTGGSVITKYVVKYSSIGGGRGSWTQFVPSPSLPITASSCTVTGLTIGTPYVIKVIAQNAVGISLPSANSAPATPLAAALTPTFGATTATVDGFTVPITNYDSSYSWAGTATASGTVAIDGTGLVTVTGVAAGGANSTATITTAKSNTAGGSADVTASSLVAMSMVTVGNAGNAADTTSYGAVSYSYQIGAYDVTGSQYTAFLNAVGSTDTYGLYNANMGTDPNVGQISQSGSPGSYTYAVMNSTGNRPITYVSWFDSARFANWMANGQPSGAQVSTTTEDGAYNVNGAISGNAVAANATNPNTTLAPTYRIPLENEWYKAAYYSPDYGGSGVGGYFWYATQSNSAPGTTIGSSPNQANYNGAIGHATDVGSFSGSGSFYGTFDQSGNVFQWNDLDGTAGSSRGRRGGGWYDYYSDDVSSSNRRNYAPSSENDDVGFRLASPV